MSPKKLTLQSDLYLQLLESTQKVAEGRFESIDASSADPEIKELISSYNQMIEHLEKTTVSKDYMDNIVTSMVNALIVLNPDKTIRLANQSALQLLGYTEEELVGKRSSIIFPEEEDISELKGLDAFVRTNVVRNLEKTFLSKKGVKIPILFSYSVMRDKDGKIQGIIFVAQDITERKRAQEALIQASKSATVGILAAGTAHEVKNPLAILLQGVDFISSYKDQVASEDFNAVLQDMRMAVQRADTIIKGLLDLTRPSQILMQEQNLNTVLESALLLLKNHLDRHKVKISKELDSNLPVIKLDKDRMVQVFINLLTNAADAMQGPGQIQIKTSSEILKNFQPGVGRRKEDILKIGEEVVIVEMTDSGSGIPADILTKIFEPFFTTKRGRGGTGLGLPIVFNTIQMHRGLIEIRNRPEGGAFVKITLPVKMETTSYDDSSKKENPDRRR